MTHNQLTITLIEPTARLNTPPTLRKIRLADAVTLEDFAKSLGSRPEQPMDLIVGGFVDNRLVPLNHQLTDGCSVQLLDLGHPEGQRIYQRTALFLLCAAARDVFPHARVRIEHTLSNGIYGEVKSDHRFSVADVTALKAKMNELIAAGIPISAKSVPLAEAKEMIRASQTEHESASVLTILDSLDVSHVRVTTMGDFVDYCDGPLLPSTAYVKYYSLRHYMPGFILQTPEKAAPPAIPPYREQPKLTGVYREADRWAKIMRISDLASLNALNERQAQDLINVNEALHEKKIARIADQITANPDIRLVTIAGPSSSGKTTLSQRLLIHLRVNGLQPLTLHLDDYFLSREETPVDNDGNPDFEAIEAIDLPLFNDHLSRLIEGETVEVPTFDFTIGRRRWTGRTLSLAAGQPIIVEGIHGLNDRLTSAIPKVSKYKIYISALTQLNIHDHVRIHTTDARLLRRMVRDAKYRSHNADATLSRWPLVRRGEETNIFPFQEDADVMINSALLYELPVLKPFAEQQLRTVPETSPNRPMADHLLWLLSHVKPMPSESIPANSILREFIGGSCFA